MADLNPTTQDFVQGPFSQPASPGLTTLLEILSAADRGPMASLGYLNTGLERRQAKHDAAASMLGYQAAGDSLADPQIPSQVQDRRGVVGSLLQDMHILGAPEARPISDREKAAAIYGASIKTKMNVARALAANKITTARRAAFMAAYKAGGAQYAVSQFPEFASELLTGEGSVPLANRKSKRDDLLAADRFGMHYGSDFGSDVAHAMGAPQSFQFPGNLPGIGQARQSQIEHRGVLEDQGERRLSQGDRGLDLKETQGDRSYRLGLFRAKLAKMRDRREAVKFSKEERSGVLKDIKDSIAATNQILTEADKQSVADGLRATSDDPNWQFNHEQRKQDLRDHLASLVQLQARVAKLPVLEMKKRTGDAETQDTNDFAGWYAGGRRLEPAPKR